MDKQEASQAIYAKYLKESIEDSEATCARWQKFDEDYATLDSFLSDLVQHTKKDVMVPLGPLAFAPGQIYHTNEVLVLLGDNWFMEQSTHQAKQIIARRAEHTQEQLSHARSTLADLRAREKLLFSDPKLGNKIGTEGSRLDEDGDEVNEEGMKYVEIREDYDEQQENEKKAAAASHRPPPIPDVPSHLGEFEKTLFDKIARLEREEEEGLEESEEEEDSDDGTYDSEDEARYEVMDDDDDDFNDAPPEHIASQVPEVVERPIQKPTSILKPTSALKPTSTPIKDHAEPHRPIRNVPLGDAVVEHIDVDDVSEEETDDFLFGRELQSEYYRRRQQMIQAQSIIPQTPEQEDVRM
ncbi:hypothetical protein DFS34DRAFT_610144 [Phlyctochytrium arcticum]|nr:hypothetical protein DFS34DRAFT_610144 [Phlyctochytrium arcticum]